MERMIAHMSLSGGGDINQLVACIERRVQGMIERMIIRNKKHCPRVPFEHQSDSDKFIIMRKGLEEVLPETNEMW